MAVLKKAAFYTLGCKLNFSETSTISRDFTKEGFERVDFSEPADVYVINTCSVTQNADKRFKSIVKQAQKSNPTCVPVDPKGSKSEAPWTHVDLLFWGPPLPTDNKNFQYNY